MALTVMTLAKVALASAAGYAAARWLSTATRKGTRPAPQPMLPAASTRNGANHNTSTPDEAWLPREGGHPGQEPVDFGASDRPRG